jgi:hypothetical protein
LIPTIGFDGETGTGAGGGETAGAGDPAIWEELAPVTVTLVAEVESEEPPQPDRQIAQTKATHPLCDFLSRVKNGGT